MGVEGYTVRSKKTACSMGVFLAPFSLQIPVKVADGNSGAVLIEPSLLTKHEDPAYLADI